MSPVYTIFCLQQEATARECGHARLHGPRGAVQEHGVRLQRGLVQLRLHALQTAEGAQSLQTAQNKGGVRNMNVGRNISITLVTIIHQIISMISLISP